MRRALVVYALSGASFLTLYAVGGFTGWWRGIVRWAGTGSSYVGGRGSGGGSSGWSGGGGGFRGGK